MAATKPKKAGHKVAAGEKIALTHAIYDLYFTPEEREAARARLGDVEQELEICRIRLARAVRAEAEQEKRLAEIKAEDEREKKELVLQELDTEQVVIKDQNGRRRIKSGIINEKRRFKRTNFADIFDRLMARIESLERTRHWLKNAAKPDNPDDNTLAPVKKIEVTVVQGKVPGAQVPGTEDDE